MRYLEAGNAKVAIKSKAAISRWLMIIMPAWRRYQCRVRVGVSIMLVH